MLFVCYPSGTLIKEVNSKANFFFLTRLGLWRKDFRETEHPKQQKQKESVILGFPKVPSTSSASPPFVRDFPVASRCSSLCQKHTHSWKEATLQTPAPPHHWRSMAGSFPFSSAPPGATEPLLVNVERASSQLFLASYSVCSKPYSQLSHISILFHLEFHVPFCSPFSTQVGFCHFLSIPK